MVNEFEFEIPGLPVPCARPRVVRQPGRRARTFMPATTVAYENRVALAALAARPEGWPLNAAYSVTAIFYRGANRGDIDNLLKSLLDGATGVLWKNDSTVLAVSARMYVLRTRPRTTVRVEIIDE